MALKVLQLKMEKFRQQKLRIAVICKMHAHAKLSNEPISHHKSLLRTCTTANESSVCFSFSIPRITRYDKERTWVCTL